jgi:hypothetical protein
MTPQVDVAILTCKTQGQGGIIDSYVQSCVTSKKSGMKMTAGDVVD